MFNYTQELTLCAHTVMEPGGFATETAGEDGGVASTATATVAGGDAAEDDAAEIGVDGAKEGLRRAFPHAAGVVDFDTLSAS